MNNTEKDISIIIPIYNEALNLTLLYNRLVDVLVDFNTYEIIFVNDGSQDESLSIIHSLCQKNKHVQYINFSRNFGHQAAISAGLDFCKGKTAVIMDGDLQDPPELIPSLYSKHQEGYNVVYAKRNKRLGETAFKKGTAKLYYRILNNLTSVNIPLDTGDFRLIDRTVIDALKRMPEKDKFIRGQIAWLGFKQTEVSYERQERLHGETAYSFKQMMRLAITGITSFSNEPLKYVTKIGFLISGISLLIIFYALYSHFILEKTVQGWTSIIISTMFIGGIQLISIGVIGVYIQRIHNNILQRPLYVISDSNIKN